MCTLPAAGSVCHFAVVSFDFMLAGHNSELDVVGLLTPACCQCVFKHRKRLLAAALAGLRW